MGGKARLRKWLVSLMPQSCETYIEPFVGKGNVFYLSRNVIQAVSWTLSDIDCRFLLALQQADFDMLPAYIERVDYLRWKLAQNDAISILVEPRITFAGKGYAHGFSGSSGTHVGYSGLHYKPVCQAARLLLADATIIQRSWEDTLASVNCADFVYLDPPYYGTQASYNNIDHAALVNTLNQAKFKWLLSGYDNQLYSKNLQFLRKLTCERNSEIKSSNIGMRIPVIETVWMNYV